MNKAIAPRQLELIVGKTREELILARWRRDIHPGHGSALKADREKFDKIELAEAAKAAHGQKAPDEVEDFDWNTDDAVILKEQRATAVYHNKMGELIIRQRAAWDDEQDTFVYVAPENVTAFLEGAAKKARE